MNLENKQKTKQYDQSISATTVYKCLYIKKTLKNQLDEVTNHKIDLMARKRLNGFRAYQKVKQC